MNSVVELNNVIKKYGNKSVVDNLNLKINKGEIFGLLGPNGAGKSTTMNMICSLKKPTAGKELKEAVNRSLDFVELSEHRNGFAKNFSGGMKRRLNIACALSHNPELLIFDEPTVGIDPQSRNFILDKIKEINKKGATVIYTSHYMEEIEAICTRIGIMDKGQLIACGTKEELISMVSKDDKDMSLEEVFLTLTGRK